MKALILVLAISLSAYGQKSNNGSRVIFGTTNHCEPSGGTDDYACTLEATLTAYVTGLKIQMKADVANTGAATVDVTGLGVKSIVKVTGGVTTALETNDIRAGQIVELIYDGANFQMQSTSGNSSSSSSALSIVVGSPNAVVGAGFTRYSGGGIPWNAAESNGSALRFPATGTLSNLYALTGSAQPASGSMTCTLRVAATDTGITFTIAANAGVGTFSDLVNTASITSGDLLSLKCVNAATGNSASILTWSARFQ